MAVLKVKAKQFSGLGSLFNGFLAKKLNEVIDAVNGTTVAASAAVTALEPITTADATDEASAIALANANKAKINAVIAALQATDPA